MKKFLVIVLALVMVLAVSTTAFAAASDRAMEVTDENNGKALGIEKQQGDGRLMALFEEYYQDGINDLEQLKTDHEAFHESAKEERETLSEAIKADFESIKDAIEDGSISVRDGRRQQIELRISIRNMRNELDEISLAKMDTQAPVHDRLAEIRAELKVLLEQDPVDPDAVKDLLVETLSLLGQHLQNDIYYHGLKTDTAAAYGY